MMKSEDLPARHGCGFARPVLVLGLIALTAIGGCGSRQPEGPLDPYNELPFGHVDKPVDGAEVGRHVVVAGWALDDVKLREIRIYVDSRFAALAHLDTSRPDVTQAYPAYARGTDLHGWGAIVDLGGPGPHTVLAQAVDDDGATRDVGVLSVTVPPNGT